MQNSNTQRLVFLWCVPRSISTAFEKMIAYSNQFVTVGEPFIDIYKRSILSADDKRYANTEFQYCCDSLLEQSNNSPVFVKDMAYHALPFIRDDLIQSTSHVFLTRDPQLSIPSLYQMRPDFSDDQPGFEGQYALFKRVRDISGITPLVIDGEHLRDNPQNIVASFYDYIGYDMPADVLQWPKGSRQEWKGREEWHIDAINSESFTNRTSPPDYSNLPDRITALIGQNKYYYEQLRQHINT